jgi:hypothetical protein
MIEGIRIVNIYLPNGNPVGSDNFAYKLAWMERLRRARYAEAVFHTAHHCNVPVPTAVHREVPPRNENQPQYRPRRKDGRATRSPYPCRSPRPTSGAVAAAVSRSFPASGSTRTGAACAAYHNAAHLSPEHKSAPRCTSLERPHAQRPRRPLLPFGPQPTAAPPPSQRLPSSVTPSFSGITIACAPFAASFCASRA